MFSSVCLGIASLSSFLCDSFSCCLQTCTERICKALSWLVGLVAYRYNSDHSVPFIDLIMATINIKTKAISTETSTKHTGSHNGLRTHNQDIVVSPDNFKTISTNAAILNILDN